MNKKIYRYVRAYIVISSLSLSILLLILTFVIGPDVVQNNRRVWMMGQVISFEDVGQKAVLPEYFILEVSQERKIKVYYNCINTKENFNVADTVEVLGFAIGYETITVCDNPQSYIKNSNTFVSKKFPQFDTWDEYSNYCRQEFSNTGICPKDFCEIGCGGGGDIPGAGCVIGCNPKLCQSYSAQDCPMSICQIMTNCTGGKQCYNKFQGETPSCGLSGYFGQTVECCADLVKRCGQILPNGSCDPRGGGYENFPICLACGNGICDTLEDYCNCPQDCKK